VRSLARLVRTGATFERTGAMAVVLEALGAPRALRVGLRALLWPVRWLGYPGDPAVPPAPRALTALGPAYVKFGQILSTRPDVVGPELAAQLRRLQDRLPPFPAERARAEVERELEAPVETLFSEFSEPVAAASIAQVHRARLRDTGEEVAVKVLRPHIEAAFKRDTDAFRLIATLLELLVPASRRLRPRDVVAHFEGVVAGELDLRLEASAASEFADNTVRDEGFRVPRVRWALSGRRVMTLDWVEGIGAGDVAAIAGAGHDTEALARRVLGLFLRHALRDGLFHGDMHQGNLKVDAEGNLVALDFGIMGASTPTHGASTPRSSWASSAATTGAWPRPTSRRATCRPSRTWTSSPAPCAPWASPSSAWTPRASPWGGSFTTSSR
jgi:ubiquinone biosynthesis protein